MEFLARSLPYESTFWNQVVASLMDRLCNNSILNFLPVGLKWKGLFYFDFSKLPFVMKWNHCFDFDFHLFHNYLLHIESWQIINRTCFIRINSVTLNKSQLIEWNSY